MQQTKDVDCISESDVMALRKLIRELVMDLWRRLSERRAVDQRSKRGIAVARR